ncbi:MAG: hypothetical protein ACK4TF_07005 [Thermodesulfovibrionales bacterium]
MPALIDHLEMDASLKQLENVKIVEREDLRRCKMPVRIFVGTASRNILLRMRSQIL